MAPTGNRSKGLTIMLLPLMMFTFIIGFCLYCFGDEKRTGKTKCKPLENDQIRIMPLVLEEQEELISA